MTAARSFQTRRPSATKSFSHINLMFHRQKRSFASCMLGQHAIKSIRPSNSRERKTFDLGPFQHQGQPIEAWCRSGYRSFLEMATGSGKTITAMICACRLYEKHKPLLIVVGAPYIPLIQQWCEEMAPFGMRTVNLSMEDVRGRSTELNRIRRGFRNGPVRSMRS